MSNHYRHCALILGANLLIHCGGNAASTGDASDVSDSNQSILSSQGDNNLQTTAGIYATFHLDSLNDSSLLIPSVYFSNVPLCTPFTPTGGFYLVHVMLNDRIAPVPSVGSNGPLPFPPAASALVEKLRLSHPVASLPTLTTYSVGASSKYASVTLDNYGSPTGYASWTTNHVGEQIPASAGSFTLLSINADLNIPSEDNPLEISLSFAQLAFPSGYTGPASGTISLDTKCATGPRLLPSAPEESVPITSQ